MRPRARRIAPIPLSSVRLYVSAEYDCVAMFTALGLKCRSVLFDQLGCERDDGGSLIIDPVTEETSASGVYAAGDSSRDVLLVIVAAAEGAKAAIAIDRALVEVRKKAAATEAVVS